jgi:predicted NBD/HSP70 family sugar kinase
MQIERSNGSRASSIVSSFGNSLPWDSSSRNLKDVRSVNRAVVLRTIWNGGAISRAELAEVTGLNPATLTRITRELTEGGLIEEVGLDQSTGGRPRTLLRVRKQAGHVLAVQIERNAIFGVLTNLDFEKVNKREIASISVSDPQALNISVLLEFIRSLISKAPVDRDRILGIGICGPGPLDSERGIFLSPPNFPGWSNTPLCQIVEEEFGYRTLLGQNAQACALAEKWFGDARELENFVYILADTGVGSAVFLNGDIYRGKRDVAGEIGHTTIDLNGPQCGCGNIGCLELYAAPLVAEIFVRQQVAAGNSSLMTAWTSGSLELISFEKIAQAAHQGDAVCREAIQKIAKPLAIGVTNVINTFDPEAVFLGGRISLAEDLLLTPICEYVRQSVLLGTNTQIPVQWGKLRTHAPLAGAFSLVLQEFFQNPAIHSTSLGGMNVTRAIR